jgi:hypothetical protein
MISSSETIEEISRICFLERKEKIQTTGDADVPSTRAF